jgi:hypothetical protein
MSRGWKKSPMSSIRLRPDDPDGIAARLWGVTRRSALQEICDTTDTPVPGDEPIGLRTLGVCFT